VEKVTTVLASKVKFESKNPVTSLIDVKTGRLKDQSVLKERTLSAIIECKASEKRCIAILNLPREAFEEIRAG
jgi:ketopantoate reductase